MDLFTGALRPQPWRNETIAIKINFFEQDDLQPNGGGAGST
jgi:hypothetical protein